MDDNVRVISDRANRLKSNLTLVQLQDRALRGRAEFRPEYRRIAAYLHRELIFAEIDARSAVGGPAGKAWLELARQLKRILERPIIPVCDSDLIRKH